MSRVLNIRATEEELTALCAKLEIGVSVLEPLLSGGTRIVLSSAEGVAILRRAAAKQIIDTPTKRSSLYLARTQPSYL